MDQNNNNTPTSPASPQQPDPSDNEHTPHQHHLVQANATLLLRTELDHLLEKFRLDTTIENAPQLATEVRLALEEEFILLISQYTHATYQQAVVMTLDDSKRLPIHLACDKNAPLSILTSLLDADEGNLSIGLADKWGDLPIHTACSRHQTEVVKLLVDSDVSKRTLHTKADNGSLPLHTAVRYGAPPSVIELLLDGDYDKSTLFQSDCYGQLPLHAACRNGASPTIIQLLLHHDEAKQTILQEDTVGRIPIHLALLHTTENQLAVLQVLLHGMLRGRMERKGINLWKIEMKSLLKSMTETTHERSFTTRDKLDMVCESIQQFMERVFVLELAVWRASCLKFDARFGSMEEVLEHESQLLLLENDGGGDLVLDVHGYKVDRRIMSGADVVIHHVIPFLEDEPVEDLMQQFRDYS